MLNACASFFVIACLTAILKIVSLFANLDGFFGYNMVVFTIILFAYYAKVPSPPHRFLSAHSRPQPDATPMLTALIVVCTSILLDMIVRLHTLSLSPLISLPSSWSSLTVLNSNLASMASSGARWSATRTLLKRRSSSALPSSAWHLALST